MMAVLFGEARAAISLSLFDRAETYFHGGIADVECDAGLGAAVTAAHGLALPAPAMAESPVVADAHTHGHDHGHDSEHAGEHGGEGGPPSLASLNGDLWSYLNARLHPTGHRHLAGLREERELLPWLWASARVDPHNVLAYEVGAYWLARRLKKEDEALAFIAEGIRNNPGDAELEFCRGEILLAARRDFTGAAGAFELVRRKWQPGTTAEEKEDNSFMLARALMYLGDISEKQGTPEKARVYYEETLKVLPGHRGAAARLQAVQAGSKGP